MIRSDNVPRDPARFSRSTDTCILLNFKGISNGFFSVERRSIITWSEISLAYNLHMVLHYDTCKMWNLSYGPSDRSGKCSNFSHFLVPMDGPVKNPDIVS